MTNDLDTVVSTMDSVFSRQDSPAGWLWQPLLRQLARGEPLTIADLAAATGRAAPPSADPSAEPATTWTVGTTTTAEATGAATTGMTGAAGEAAGSGAASAPCADPRCSPCWKTRSRRPAAARSGS